MSLSLLSSAKCYGGVVRKYSHTSTSTETVMKFSVFLPSIALSGSRVPSLYWLSGLTCNEDNFITKAGAFREAEKQGIALICPDTSPRGTNIEGEHDSYDFGSGAGFYVDATSIAFAKNYNMYSYVTKELPTLVESQLPVTCRKSILGHSMGGHGALVCFLRNPGIYASVSAFAPICHPTACAWGRKAFTGYLGHDETAWNAYDASKLVRSYNGPKDTTIIIEQGSDDHFLQQQQLLPVAFVDAAKESAFPVRLNMREGYDHSYFFIATFIDEHIIHHANALKKLADAKD